ncbi:hypothetical protein PT974_07931 [Cladobotryum mycophilum]|uniref:Uncharacterized protein n=1 Tax=Cladobotryum mycophilum TaxID=491253 RepID=A0ABR0SDE7_9HYPO
MAHRDTSLFVSERLQYLEKCRLAFLELPFLDDAEMQGAPNLSIAAFETPKLRRCPFNLASVNWRSKSTSALGGGLDGFVWKVSFGDDGPYALKVFWDKDPPEFPHYFALQRECQNMALLQRMEAAVTRAAEESRPIQVKANPRTRDEALANTFAFADENSQSESSTGALEGDGDTVTIHSMPRMKKCFGWLRFDGQLIQQMPLKVRPPVLCVNKIRRAMSNKQDYIALVYEYVEEDENPPELWRRRPTSLA